jgi:hypothetical protein
MTQPQIYFRLSIDIPQLYHATNIHKHLKCSQLLWAQCIEASFVSVTSKADSRNAVVPHFMAGGNIH